MAKKPIKAKPSGECKTCGNHYGEHNEAVTREGEPKRFILCKCILSSYDKLMSESCQHYTPQS